MGFRGWRRRQIQESPIVVHRPSCWVRYGPYGNKCAKPRWGWTNHMEPLCRDHFAQRRVIQNLLILMSGRGNWAGLVVFTNPEGFKQYKESYAESQ